MAAVLLAAAMVGAPRVLDAVRRARNPMGNAAIPSAPLPTWSAPTPPSRVTPAGQPRYVTAVGPDHRTFVDQYGHPVLVRGDTPWPLLTRASAEEVDRYVSTRRAQGFNAAIVSLLGARGNGGPSDDGATVDGLLPFEGGDVTRLVPAYWDRAHDYLARAAAQGITVFLYATDAWAVGTSFRPADDAACAAYGRQVAERFADLPNIVWLAGGDYLPQGDDASAGSDVDRCISAMVAGIRSTGDTRPFSVQLGYDGAFTTTGNPYWESRVDWSFVYSYYPTYRAVQEAYADPRPVPALLGEANYERENNQPKSLPTTDQTLRRQVLWSLTSGAAGDFYGSADWALPAGWLDRLDTSGVRQVGRLRALVESLPWWQLVPDADSRFLTSGRGTPVALDQRLDVLDDNYATATITPDGSTALVYLPTARSFILDPSRLRPGVRASWVDPATGAERPAAVTDRYTTPGPNAEGDPDWLLVFRGG